LTEPLAEEDDASTPLTPEEREGLIPSYITLRRELNEAEQANILEGDAWAFSRKRDVLDEGFLNTLHKRMYGNVWRWAGTYERRSRKRRSTSRSIWRSGRASNGLFVRRSFDPAR
jgi:fido (protein-threonine AMPylation protein)